MEKKIHKYPCSKCKRLTDGTILVYQYVSENLTVVRFKKDCCGEEVGYFNQHDLKHYIQEFK